METSRSLLRQVTGYSMFFVFLILFASGILGEKNATLPSQESATASPAVVSTNDTIPTKKMIAKDTGSDVSSEASTVSKLLVATSSNKETPSKSTMSVEQPSTIKPTDTVAERKEPVTLKQTKQATSTPVVHVSATPEATTEVAATPAEMKTTKVGHKTNTTVTVLTASNKTATTVKSTGQIPRSSKGKKEMNTTTPGQHVQADHTTHANTSSKRTESQSTTVTSIIKASEADVGKTESPSKGSGGVTGTSIIETSESHPKMTASSSKGVTVAIVLSVLLVLVLLIALLFCWRRRRSGSTSFNSAGWAGQAALPDDSGLDKEVEQGALTAGEGETRRATLTTFFGKRQSRVPSVALEEVVQKGTVDVEEAQQLIDGDASRVSSPEGPGEANGKLLEPSEQRSQDTEFPPPPANQEDTPPTPLE